MKLTPEDIETINVCAGQNIEKRRRMLRMSQADLGKLAGVSPQQIHKYETGETRIPLDKIYLLTHALDINLEDLFIGINSKLSFAKSDHQNQNTALGQEEADKLMKHYISIDDPKARDIISSLTVHLSKVYNFSFRSTTK